MPSPARSPIPSAIRLPAVRPPRPVGGVPRRPARRRSAAAALLALGAGVALLAAPPADAEEKLVDGIAAQVGGRTVLLSEVLRTVSAQEQAMREAGAPESEIAKLRADGLERLIESRLIEQLIEESERYATDEEVNRTIEGIAEENGLSLEQLYASVVFHGMSVEQYRAQIKRDLERRSLINAVVGPRVDVEDAEVEALYRERFGDQPEGGEAVRVRQILRTYGGVSKRPKEVACDEVRAARRRVVEEGASFPEVASEVSEVAPRDGGEIGWLHLDQVASWMSESLDGLEPGGVSDLIVLPFGCSILQLVEQRSFEPVTLEQARDRLAQEVWERELEEEYRAWMEELRQESYIERRGYFADAASFGDATFPLGTPPESALP